MQFILICVNILNPLEEFDGKQGGMLIGKQGATNRGALKAQETTFAIGNWPGYIDSELWLKCQHKLDTNQQVSSNDGPRTSWLTGLLK